MASATPVDDEATLIAQLRAGDEAAFEQVVRQYGGRLLAVARRIVGSEEDARDVVQDAFLNAFKSLDRFEGNAKLSTWLHRIAVNAALMKLRTRKRKPEQSIETLLPSLPGRRPPRGAVPELGRAGRQGDGARGDPRDGAEAD